MLVMTFFILTSASVVLFLIWKLLEIKRLYNKTAQIPGPLCYPLIGNGYVFLGSPDYIFKNLLETMNFYDSPTRIAFGPRVFVFLKNPKQIETVLRGNKTLEKDSIYNLIRPLLGVGLGTAEHKIWRVHRKLLQPTFSTQFVQSLNEIFQKNSLFLAQSVEKNIGCPEFQLLPYISKAIFCNTIESILGLPLEAESENNIESYLDNIDRLMVLTFERIKRVWLHVYFICIHSEIGKKSLKYLREVNNYTDILVQKKRKIMQQYQNDSNEDTKIKTPLEFMIEESKFSPDEIRQHLLAIITGSYDTSARALGYLFLMLASHPDIQDRVYEEIFNIYGDDDVESNPVKYEDLQKLPYLDRVIKETLRLFPTLPYIARQASDDFDLDGYFIPKNCGVVINIFALHRDERIWPDPLKFDPDRFSNEAMSQRHSCDYIPFSYGPRNCIGRLYGVMSMKIVAVTFLRKYIIKKDQILPVKDIKLQMDILLKSVEPIKIGIERR